MKRIHNPLRKFAIDIGWAFSGSVVGAIVGFVLNLIIGNSLGADELGLYGIVLTFYLIGTMTAAIGLPGALIKYGAEYQQTPAKLDSVVSATLLMSTSLSLLISFSIFVLSSPIGHLLDMSDLPVLLRILAFIFPLFMINKTLLALLNGLRRMHLVSLAENLRYILIMVFTLAFITAGYNIQAVVYAMIIPEVCLLPVIFFFTRRLYNLSWQNFRATTRMMTFFGLQTFLGNVINNVSTRLNLFLIGYFLAEADVGIFSVASMFYLGLILFPTAVQRITNPTISAQHGRKSMESIDRTVNQVMKYVMILSSAISVLFIIFAKSVIQIAFPNDPQFLEAVPPLIILMFSLPSYSAISAIGSTPASMGQPRWSIIYAITALSTNLILNLLLLPNWGINGSAAATSITNLLLSLLFIYILHRALLIRIQFTVLIKLFLIYVLLNLLTLFALQLGLHPLILAPLAIILYTSLLLFASILERQDINLLQRLFNPAQ